MDMTPDVAFGRLVADGFHDAAQPSPSFELLVDIELANVERLEDGVRYVLREIGA